MPVVKIPRNVFIKHMGKEYDPKELDKIGFQFGIEINEIFVEQQETKLPFYSFEIASNRPDLQCAQGIIYALQQYTFNKLNQTIEIEQNLEKPTQQIFVGDEVTNIREFIVGAIIYDVFLEQEVYDSFIDYQDVLHGSFCRQRKLASMGTHDLDKIEFPINYVAKAPQEINFQALSTDQILNGQELIKYFEQKSHIKPFLGLIRDKPYFPVIYDNNQHVLSMPPIINSEYSKMEKNKTQNIFIQITAVDQSRALICLNQLIFQLAFRRGTNFRIEPVEIIYPNGRKTITPNLMENRFVTSVEYLNQFGPFEPQITSNDAIQYLKKMGLQSQKINDEKIQVTVPIWRSDILHECDIAQDLCIAYDYMKIQQQLPQGLTVGKQIPIQKMADLIRSQMAAAGFIQILSFVLCSHASLTYQINRNFPQDLRAIETNQSNYQSTETARTEIFPGMLDALVANQNLQLPICFFQIGDVVHIDTVTQTSVVNHQRLCTVVCNKEAEFEVVHGALDFIMEQMQVKYFKPELNQINRTFQLESFQDGSFIDGQVAKVIYIDQKGETHNIGIIGNLHPKVHHNYKLKYPVSLFEISIDLIVSDYFKI